MPPSAKIGREKILFGPHQHVLVSGCSQETTNQGLKVWLLVGCCMNLGHYPPCLLTSALSLSPSLSLSLSLPHSLSLSRSLSLFVHAFILCFASKTFFAFSRSATPFCHAYVHQMLVNTSVWFKICIPSAGVPYIFSTKFVPCGLHSIVYPCHAI